MNKRTSIPLVGLFLLMAGTAHGLTLSDIETQIRRNLRDTSTDTSLQRYSDAVIDSLINEAQRDVVNQTWCLDASTGVVLTVNTTFYYLPTDLIAVKSARFTDSSNNTYVLEEKNERSFRQNNPDWQKQTGKPVNYFVRDATDTATAYQVAYYPIPGAVSSTGTVNIEYYSQATDLDDDTDVPFDGKRFMYPYHEVLVFYPTYRLKMTEGQTNDATLYFQVYKTGIDAIMSKLNSKPNWSPSFGVAPK